MKIPAVASLLAMLAVGGAWAQQPASARSFHDRYAELVANPRHLSDSARLAQLYEVFRLFAPQIHAQLVALAQALKGDLPKVNAALRAASSPRVVPRAAEIRPPAPDGR